jgi:glycosyltransferase involved in cell wall biosynthesis
VGEPKSVIPSLSIAAVLPRYGEDLGGGAEALVKSLMEVLRSGLYAKRFNVARLEVWTTCAKDHRTWDNFWPEGVSEQNNIIVRRFPVSPRDLDLFIRSEIKIASAEQLTVDEQLDWLSQGVNSNDLYQHIAAHVGEFDLVLFAPYLFPTTFWGALIEPSKSLLIPCLHNEPYAYLEVFRQLFREVRGLIFNAEPELDLAKDVYRISGMQAKSGVVGMGFEPLNLDNDSKSDSISETPYLLYSGRKETGKNLDLLINYFTRYKELSGDTQLKLKLIGSGSIDFCDKLPADVEDLGFVSEEQKSKLMKNALVLCQPSINESFSIVLMEAWQRATPVIVNENCAVTKYHVVKSNGGLFFSSEEEFTEVVRLLRTDSELSKALGKNGRAYVEHQYSWANVIKRFEDAVQKVGLIPAEHSKRSEVGRAG